MKPYTIIDSNTNQMEVYQKMNYTLHWVTKLNRSTIMEDTKLM